MGLFLFIKKKKILGLIIFFVFCVLLKEPYFFRVFWKPLGEKKMFPLKLKRETLGGGLIFCVRNT